ncbi:MAG: hypothetical protein E7260_06640 [Lachnospiraceae bacterium]|nr:hypothetical protein [Lachnospiraceae bacterium]
MEENKKESIFKKIENNILLQVVFFVVSMTVIVGGYVGLSGYAKKVGYEKGIQDAKIAEDYDILMSVETVNTEEGVMTLAGWAMRLNSVNKDVYLVLNEVDGTEQILLETKTIEREDVEEYFKPGWEFGEVGFDATVKQTEIKKDTCYEILLYLKYETEQKKEDGTSVTVTSEKKIASGKYLYNGGLYRYDSRTFTEPEFKDAFMQEVVKQGELYFYGAEEDMWIYEYQGSMYWIAGEKFGFDEEGSTYIPYHTYTWEREKLPEKDQTDGYRNFDFRFEHRECVFDEKEESYRVATRELPEEYLVTMVRTGLYDYDARKWLWKCIIPVLESFDN